MKHKKKAKLKKAPKVKKNKSLFDISKRRKNKSRD